MQNSLQEWSKPCTKRLRNPCTLRLLMEFLNGVTFYGLTPLRKYGIRCRGAPPGPRDLVFGRGLPKVLEKAVRNSRGSFQPLEQDSCGRNAICSSSPRVCFVGTLARGGENFALISELLRHSSPTMLDYYFRTGATERARAVGRMAATS